MRIYIDKPTPDIKQIVSRCFPNYRGKQYSVQVGEYPANLDSYWDSGYRSYFILYDLETGKALEIPSNHPGFERQAHQATEEVVKVLSGYNGQRILVVEHCYAGQRQSITIWAKSDSINKMLPAKVELSDAEKTVLKYTASYKNTYAGQTNRRFAEAYRETGICPGLWDKAKQSCVDKKLLNKAGAITAAGRNANH